VSATTRPNVHVVDSHVHVWDLSGGGYEWLGPQHGELYRSFRPEEAHHELSAAGVDAAVLVQAEDSVRDTEYLLGVADSHDFVAGVVGWVQLDDPALAEEHLDRFAARPAFRGVRHLVHDDPRDDFLSLPSVRRSLSLLPERGLPLDVPDAWPRHLDDVAALAADLPDLRVVLDHLGKPPRGSEDLDAWARALRAVAGRPNTVAKLSGLQVEGQPFTVTALRPAWEVALGAFGPSRLLYGGDWPMTVTAGGYAPTWRVMSALVGELSPAEQALVLGENARSVYHLEVQS
jgi:L-fuconolactonase